MKKLLLATLITVATAFTLTGCGSSTANEDNTFTIGLEAGYAPFNWTQIDDSKGAVPINGSKEFAGGYDVEIAKKIADSLGKELVVEKIEWDGLVPALNSGQIDAIMAGMSPTAERKETIDFSDNYYQSDFVVVVKSGSPYENATTLSDLSGAKITAQLNTSHYNVIDQIPGVQKEEAMTDFPAMRVAVESGIIDGYISERPEAISATSANPNFAMVELTETFQASEEETAIAVGLIKGSELTAPINEALSQISDEERLAIMDQAILNQPAAN